MEQAQWTQDEKDQWETDVARENGTLYWLDDLINEVRDLLGDKRIKPLAVIGLYFDLKLLGDHPELNLYEKPYRSACHQVIKRAEQFGACQKTCCTNGSITIKTPEQAKVCRCRYAK